MPKKVKIYKPEEVETWEGDWEPETTDVGKGIKIKVEKDKVRRNEKGEIELKTEEELKE